MSAGIQGKVVVFTGRISKPRHEFRQLISDSGGTPSDSITQKTDYLVVGEGPGSKLIRAQMLGVRIISEQELFQLIQDQPPKLKELVEEPMTLEEVQELKSHRVYIKCKWCGEIYKLWDNLPNYETCPVCELLSHPHCPHCNDDLPLFVEDFNLYSCRTCGTWFQAPHSRHINSVKHLHFWIKKDLKRTCPCGYQITLKPEDVEASRIKYEKAPQLIKEWRLQNLQQVKKEKKEKALQEQEVTTQDWFNSLTDEQREALKEKYAIQ